MRKRELDRILRCAYRLGGRDAVMAIVVDVRKDCRCPGCDGKGKDPRAYTLNMSTGIPVPDEGGAWFNICFVCTGSGTIRVRDACSHIELCRRELERQSPKKP